MLLLLKRKRFGFSSNKGMTVNLHMLAGLQAFMPAIKGKMVNYILVNATYMGKDLATVTLHFFVDILIRIAII